MVSDYVPIRNWQELIEGNSRDSQPREMVLDALRAAIEEADPALAVKRKIRVSGNHFQLDELALNLDSFKRIIVIGGGKASAKMAEALNEILHDRITGGAINVPDYIESPDAIGRIKLHRAAHPIPDSHGINGVNNMLNLVDNVSTEDLVICLLSGGGSALMPLPAEGVTLNEKQIATSLLLKQGATINELNAVRKHLSAIKGGRLAQKLYPSTVVALIVSDVVGDIIDTVASGPTSPDNTTSEDAITVLKKYDAWNDLSQSVRDVILRGTIGQSGETPKSGDKAFEKVHNIVIASNRLACEAALARLSERGLNSTILTSMLQGEASQVGIFLASIAREIEAHNSPLAKPAAIVMGGESTVTVRGSGAGGRNQELSLSVGLAISGLEGTAFASMGTDGIDGQTNAAGAIVDGKTVSRALRLKLTASDYLRRNDSHSFFAQLGDLILTGPTGTNVNDISVAVLI